jgi:hypothetical protein
MSTQGQLSAQVNLDPLALPISLILSEDPELDVSLIAGQGKLSLPALVGFLLNDQGFKFPVVAGFLNGVAVKSLGISIFFKREELDANGTFADIAITSDSTLHDPTLSAVISRSTQKVCVSGTVQGGVFNGMHLHFCSNNDWEPKDDNGNSPVNPSHPPASVPAGDIGWFIAILVGLGATAATIIGIVVADGIADAEIAADLLAAGESAGQVADGLAEMGRNSQQILQALYEGLETVEAVEAELQALEATIEARYPVEPLESILGDLLPAIDIPPAT